MFGHWQNWLSGGGLGGFALIILFLVEKFHPKGWTMSKRLYAAIIGAFFVLGASFMTWKDQRESIDSLQAQITSLKSQLDSLSTSQFKVTPLTGIFGVIPQGSQATLVLRLNNTGASTAIPEDTWMLSAKTSDGVVHKAAMTMLQHGNTDLCMAGFGVRRFVPSDALYERASHPIGSGEYRIGVLHVNFQDGLSKSDLLNPATDIELQALDVHEKKYSWNISVSELENKQGAIFLPSIANPTNISTPSCPINGEKQ